MFFYSSSSKFLHVLKVYILAQTKNEAWLETAAEWAEKKWGYIRHFPGIEYRKEIIRRLNDKFYIVTYANQPIGMFALLDYSGIKDMKGKKLAYFYVDEQFRGLGIGARMLKIVKTLCNKPHDKLHKNLIVFNTLNPNLNRFYEKQGAKAVCESQVLGQPTTVMRI